MNEIKVFATTSNPVYALVYNQTGLVWNDNTEDFELFNEITVADYAISCADAGGGLFLGSFPTAITDPAVYLIDAREQAGGAPDAADSRIGSTSLHWSGTAEITNAGDIETENFGTIIEAIEKLCSVLFGATTKENDDTIYFKDADGNIKVKIVYGAEDGVRSTVTLY